MSSRFKYNDPSKRGIAFIPRTIIVVPNFRDISPKYKKHYLSILHKEHEKNCYMEN